MKFEKGDVIISKDGEGRYMTIIDVNGDFYGLINSKGDILDKILGISVDNLCDLEPNYLKRKRLEGLLK